MLIPEDLLNFCPRLQAKVSSARAPIGSQRRWLALCWEQHCFPPGGEEAGGDTFSSDFSSKQLLWQRRDNTLPALVVGPLVCWWGCPCCIGWEPGFLNGRENLSVIPNRAPTFFDKIFNRAQTVHNGNAI